MAMTSPNYYLLYLLFLTQVSISFFGQKGYFYVL